METFHLESALMIFKFYLPVEGRWWRPRKGLELGGGGLREAGPGAKAQELHLLGGELPVERVNFQK